MFSALSVHAQVLYGTITGNVTDSSGAVVSDAPVQVIDKRTGVTRETQSNSEGIYAFKALNPGIYSVKITAPTFSVFQQDSVTVTTNATFRVDAVLKVGAANETVEVSAESPALKTDKADVSYTISEQQLTELPTAGTTGRNVQNLYALVPGSSPPAEQNSQASNPQRAVSVNVNGITNGSNTIRIDGAIDVHPRLSYLAAYVPPADALETIDVVTNSFNAEQGAAGGSAINMVIKSGTNNFHGGVWAYNSIAQFNAQSWSNRTGILQKNILNEDGASVGGPILHNKLFFFFDYDRTTTSKAINNILSVPTQAMRHGDFSAFTNLTAGCTPAKPGSCVFIYDPVTGSPIGTGKTVFSANKIPGDRIAPAASKLLTGLPLPNTGAPDATVNNYFGSAVTFFERQNYDSKLTYVPNDKMTIFAHYSASPDTINDPPAFGPNPGGPALDGGQPGTASGLIQNVGLGSAYALTPHVLIDADFGYTRFAEYATGADASLGDYGVSGLGIPGTNNNGQAQYAGIPGMVLTTFSNLGNSFAGNPLQYRENEYTGNVNTTYNHGKHSWRFGGEYLHVAVNDFQTGTGNAFPRGGFTFNGGVTAASGGSLTSANSFADFLLGQAQSYGKAVQNFNPATLRSSIFSFYAQDTWQASKNLTLNYGARYEYYPIPVYDHFGTLRYDPSVLTPITDALGTHKVGTVIVGGEGGNDQHAGISNGWGFIVPRFGAAYRVTDKTVVRAGAGITVDSDSLRGLVQAYPSQIITTVAAANSYIAATSLNSGLQSTTTQVGIPAVVLPSIQSGFVPLPETVSTYSPPKDFRRGYIETWNLTVQQQLPGNFVSSIAYVGNHAIRQQINQDINAANPGGGQAGRALNLAYGPNTSNTEEYSYTPIAGSRYAGLQTQLSHLSTKNVSTGVIYTWSKAQDAADDGESGKFLFANAPYLRQNFALAGYDRTNNLRWWTVSALPFGKGQPFIQKGLLSYVVGGWKVNTILSCVSGTPMTVTASSGLLNAPGNTQVADRVQGAVAILRSNVNGFRQYANPAAFRDVSTAAGVTIPRFGNSGRNPIRGPGFFNLDTGLKKTFPIRDNFNLQFVAEAFDVTNTPQFANPNLLVTNSAFGQLVTSNANRTVRLSGRITF
jgi:hypothetical protein